MSTVQVAPTTGHMPVLKQPPGGVLAPESQVPARSGQNVTTLSHAASETEHWPPVGRQSVSAWQTLPIGPVQWPAIPQLPGVHAAKSIVHTPPRSGHSGVVPKVVQAWLSPVHRAVWKHVASAKQGVPV